MKSTDSPFILQLRTDSQDECMSWDGKPSSDQNNCIRSRVSFMMCTYLIACCLLYIWVCGELNLHHCSLSLDTLSVPVSCNASCQTRVHMCACMRAHAWLHAIHRNPMRKKYRQVRVVLTPNCRMSTSAFEHKRNQLIGLEPAPASCRVLATCSVL